MDINEQQTIPPSTNWIFYMFLSIIIIVVFLYYTRNTYWNKYSTPFINDVLTKINGIYRMSPTPKVVESGVTDLKNTILKPPIKKNKFVLPADIKPYVPQDEIKLQSGFCYIGEDRGFRSCISVGEGDLCMSGDIFPSQEVCINPNLRS